MAGRRIPDAQLVRHAVALGDPEAALIAISELRRRLDALEAAHVDDALRAGWSWQRIGTALGITRQAAHTRHAAGLRVDQAVEFGGRARVVLARARQEAGRLGCGAIETDHLLLGLALEADGPAAAALASCRLLEADIRDRLVAGYAVVPGSAQAATPAPSAALKAVVEDALREARRCGSGALHCDHLLLALLREPGGRGQRLVMTLGKTPRAVERRLNRARDKQRAAGVPQPAALPA